MKKLFVSEEAIKWIRQKNKEVVIYNSSGKLHIPLKKKKGGKK